MRFYGVVLFCLGCLAGTAHAAEANIATLSCAKYQNEFIASSGSTAGEDPINTMMWLFGYSVANSGAHVMYGDALAGFGFALDAECKNNPTMSLLDALAKIKPDNKNPMDLSALECQTFASRHVELLQSDRESTDTIMMWLFGFAVAKTGSHLFDPSALKNFEDALMADCTKNPGRSLFEELAAVKFSTPKN